MGAVPMLQDAHGRKYRRVVEAHPQAFAHVDAVLADARYQDRMVHESECGRPALRGALAAIELSPDVQAVLDGGDDADRFKQAVGVKVRLQMESLGWSTTGRKGSLGRSRWFKSAERYERRTGARAHGDQNRPDHGPVIEAHQDPNYAERVKAGLERIAQMGTQEEQAETFEYLMKALAETRAEEGRPF